jgi:hypothetical protein
MYVLASYCSLHCFQICLFLLLAVWLDYLLLLHACMYCLLLLHLLHCSLHVLLSVAALLPDLLVFVACCTAGLLAVAACLHVLLVVAAFIALLAACIACCCCIACRYAVVDLLLAVADLLLLIAEVVAHWPTMNSHESAGSAATPVNVDGYDPMDDQKWRARSNDPGWKYGYWTEIGNRDNVTCNLCKTVTARGIKRLKEHLAGGYADIVMCSKTTTEIRKEMSAYLEKNKKNRPIFLDDDGGQQQQQ